MRKYGWVLITIILIFLAGCQNESIVTNPESTTKTTGNVTAAAASTLVEDMGSTIEQAHSLCNNATDISTPESRRYEVSSFKEFIQSIGSDREIVLLPGDYSNSDDNEVVSGITNLTIIGKPENGQDYTILNSSFQFKECKDIKIENLYMKYNDSYDIGCLSFKDSSNILINHCSLSAIPSDGYEGSGIKLDNVKKFNCNNTLVENYYNNIDLFLTEDATFTSCIFTGGPVQIGDGLNDGPCKNITLKDCTLLCKAGICATWSNYVPIANPSGYEIAEGTEEWGENRSLQAIMYSDDDNLGLSLRYINTFDGNSGIFNDGKFVNLAKRLGEISSIKAFPAIDYIVAQDTDWNQYYSFDGEPESKKLVINIIEDESVTDIDKMMLKASKLKEASSGILGYGYPVTIAYRNGTNNAFRSEIIAYAEFTNSSFKAFLDDDYKTWDHYCNVIVPESSLSSGTNFFKIDSKDKEQNDTVNLQQMFLTNTITVNEGFGQTLSPLFTIKEGQDYCCISAIESFNCMGDFMHYSTDMIIKENVITGEKFIATAKKMYKVIDENNSVETIITSGQAIAAIADLPEEFKKNVHGDICKDILILLNNDNEMSETVNFIFLTAERKNPDESVAYSEYNFYYYITTYDSNAKKVTMIDPVTVTSFQDVVNREVN